LYELLEASYHENVRSFLLSALSQPVVEPDSSSGPPSLLGALQGGANQQPPSSDSVVFKSASERAPLIKVVTRVFQLVQNGLLIE
jgi:hypothetical protein